MAEFGTGLVRTQGVYREQTTFETKAIGENSKSMNPFTLQLYRGLIHVIERAQRKD